MASPLIGAISADQASDDRVTILLVDDQPAKLVTYQAILREMGEHLLEARSAREALELLLRHEVAVIVIDVCMPELDGFELAEMIRQHPRFQQTAIIFVSAVMLTDLDRLRGYAAGAVDYLPVPVVPEILRAKVGVFTDLYRKTRALEAMNRELESRVAQRSAELEATTLALREAASRKDEFLAMLAHELRNPLAPISTSAQLLKAPNLDEARRRQAQLVIERQVAHLVRLVDDLLDVSRISRGAITLDRRDVDVSEVIARAVETTRPSFEAGGVTLEVEGTDRRVVVRGDDTRLVQVVGNVLHNAAKFTDPGGTVWCRLAVLAGVASITIADNGIGIPRDMLSDVFELFVQVPSANAAKSHGLGVGLPLVRRLVEMHGGSVEISSEGAGTGTRVTIRLPLVSVDKRDDDVLADASASTTPRLRARRVLVVDDNRDAADALGALLTMQGHDVKVAYEAGEAYALGGRFEPDVVLLDLHMPDEDGLQLARRVRGQPWGRDALLVAVTGWGQPRDRQATAKVGFDAHLVKPVDLDALDKLLASAGDPWRSASPGQDATASQP